MPLCTKLTVQAVVSGQTARIPFGEIIALSGNVPPNGDWTLCGEFKPSAGRRLFQVQSATPYEVVGRIEREKVTHTSGPFATGAPVTTQEEFVAQFGMTSQEATGMARRPPTVDRSMILRSPAPRGGSSSVGPSGAFTGVGGGVQETGGIIDVLKTGLDFATGLIPGGRTVASGIGALAGGGDCPAGMKEEIGFGAGGGLFTQCIPIGGEDPIIGGPQVQPSTAIAGSVASMPGQRTYRKCPPGPMGTAMVLAKDGLCYPKALLKASDRMYRPSPKPPITASTLKAIRKADAAKKRLIKLTKQAGAYAAMNKPATTSRKKQPAQITVIDTE